MVQALSEGLPALDCGGCNPRHVAPWCLDRAMNGQSFKTCLQTQRVPTLEPGDILICEYLSAHKAARR